MLRETRKLHRWLMLFAGLQFLIWSISGVYMVLVNIHFIHGESLITKEAQPLPAEAVQYDISALLERYPMATNIRLGLLVDKPVYRFKQNGNDVMVIAETGKVVPAISETLAQRIASNSLQQEQEISSISLIVDNPPSEIGARRLPLWQVKFAGISGDTLYINPHNGEVATIRHNSWRLFDAFWRLHIMDYIEGDDINNILLNVFTIAGFLAVLAGLVLLYLRLTRSNEEEPQL
ncbi:PepSY domain-containing protein [Aliiglaciecola litoralis]|uniref:PepSY-associated TM region n=1 Tax=Aliiglaciecola litoralis TaxID=582857 RepID=A0ABN1LBY2_9ALTE